MSNGAARVYAHAKINVRLKVLALEGSGFHSLETIFVRLALADRLTVRPTTGTRTILTAGEPDLVARVGPPERNLAFRAAAAYSEITGWPRGFAIELEKRIPVGAGLGGGSADAAAALRALNVLAPDPIATGDLLRIAASLGADVPFLATDYTVALAWNRGDRMLALPPLPRREIVLLTPTFSVATGEAYAWLDATRVELRSAPLAIPLEACREWETLAAYADNDFEVPVIARHPQIAQMLAVLSGANAVIARMSGSGSTVFGVFAEAPAAPGWLEIAGCGRRVTHNAQQVVQPELTA